MSDKLIRDIQRRISQPPFPDLQDVAALLALLQRTGLTLGRVWLVECAYDDEVRSDIYVCASETGAYLKALEVAKELVDVCIENWENESEIARLQQSFSVVTAKAQKDLQEGFEHWKKATEPRLYVSIQVEQIEILP